MPPRVGDEGLLDLARHEGQVSQLQQLQQQHQQQRRIQVRRKKVFYLLQILFSNISLRFLQDETQRRYGYELLIEEALEGGGKQEDSAQPEPGALTYKGTYSVVDGGPREGKVVGQPPPSLNSHEEERPSHGYVAPVHDDHDHSRDNGNMYSEPKAIAKPPPHKEMEEDPHSTVRSQDGYTYKISHSGGSTTKVPTYTRTTVKAQGLPAISKYGKTSPYPKKTPPHQYHHQSKPTKKVHTYQTFRSPHTSYQHAHGKSHKDGEGHGYSHHDGDHLRLDQPVKLKYGPAPKPKHYSYSVLPKENQHQQPMPQIHHHSGAAPGGKDGHSTSPRPTKSDEDVDSMEHKEETQINAAVHHHSTPPTPPLHTAGGSTYTPHPASPATKPTPRAPTR